MPKEIWVSINQRLFIKSSYKEILNTVKYEYENVFKKSGGKSDFKYNGNGYL